VKAIQTVYKYELGPNITDLNLPIGAKVLHADIQYGEKLCIWVLVDTDEEHEQRRFLTVPTGVPLPGLTDEYEWVYIRTVLVLDGTIVWHVFELATNAS